MNLASSEGTPDSTGSCAMLRFAITQLRVQENEVSILGNDEVSISPKQLRLHEGYENICGHGLSPRWNLYVLSTTHEVLRLTRLPMFRADVVTLPMPAQGTTFLLPATLIAYSIPVAMCVVVGAALTITDAHREHPPFFFSFALRSSASYC